MKTTTTNQTNPIHIGSKVIANVKGSQIKGIITYLFNGIASIRTNKGYIESNINNLSLEF